MRKIRVCHITTAHSALDDRIFHKECRSLAESGYEVILIARHGQNKTIDGVKILALRPAGGLLSRIFFTSTRTLLLALSQRAHIYHFHDPEFLLFAPLLKLLTKGKLIYDVHENYGKQIQNKFYLPAPSRRVIAFLTRGIELLTSYFFDGIVTATEDIAGIFKRYKYTLCIKNYPVASYFKNGCEFKKNGRPGQDGKKGFDLIYAGEISEQRWLCEVVESMEYVDGAKLFLYGGVQSPAFLARLGELNGFKKVQYLGKVTHEEVVSQLEKYDAGIVCLRPIPNYVTALPVKMFEYMAAGIPVIASNFNLWAGIIERNRCGICVDPLNPKAIAGAIKYLMDHLGTARQMGENGRKAHLREYNWDGEKQKMLKMYKDILDGRNQATGKRRSG
ncbi:MAG: glycosyltransferase family 4 protein [Nitrospiraceae bacterium]|nr:glycosyltransferase family 4 protein [Nitrospiraceae bacterium]